MDQIVLNPSNYWVFPSNFQPNLRNERQPCKASLNANKAIKLVNMKEKILLLNYKLHILPFTKESNEL